MKLQDNLYRVIGSQIPQSPEVGVSYAFTIQLLPQSEIYRAHFPEDPITPGACLVCIVRELASIAFSRPLHITSVRNLKFLVPVRPDISGEETSSVNNLVSISIKITSLNESLIGIQGTINNENTTFCKLSLTLK